MISLVFPQIFWSGITMSPCPCLRPLSRWQWATGTESQQKLFLLRKLRLGKFWTAAIWPNPGQSEGKALKADLCLGLESLLIKQWRTFLSRPAGMLQHFLYPFLLGGPPPLQAEDWPLNFSWGNFPFTVPRLMRFKFGWWMGFSAQLAFYNKFAWSFYNRPVDLLAGKNYFWRAKAKPT